MGKGGVLIFVIGFRFFFCFCFFFSGKCTDNRLDHGDAGGTGHAFDIETTGIRFGESQFLSGESHIFNGRLDLINLERARGNVS